VNCFEKGLELMKENATLPVVTFRIKFFDRRETFHPKDYIFTETGVYNLLETPNKGSSTVVSMIRRSAIGKMRFDKSFHFFEDGLFLMNVLMNNGHQIGLVKEALYYYRKRADLDSTIDNVSQNSVRQSSDYVTVMQKLFETSRAKFDAQVLPYLQQYFLYHLFFKMNRTEDYPKIENFREKIEQLLKECDDREIRRAGKIKVIDRQRLLNIKHQGFEWRKNCNINGKGFYSYNHQRVLELERIRPSFYSAKQLPSGELELLARMPNFGMGTIEENLHAEFECSGKKNGDIIIFRHEQFDLPQDSGFEWFDDVFTDTKGIRLIVPKDYSGVVRLFAKFRPVINGEYKNEKRFVLKFGHNIEIFRLPTLVENSYKNQNPEYNDKIWMKVGSRVVITRPDDKGFTVRNYSTKLALKLDDDLFQNIEELRKKNVLDKTEVWSDQSLQTARKIRKKAIMRNFFQQKFPLPKKLNKPVWLINDRPNSASDNGYYFYKYLQKEHPEIKSYFVLSKENASLWHKLKKQSVRLVELGSTRHIKLLLKAQIVASSHANLIGNTNPFCYNLVEDFGPLYFGLYQAKFAHLWHGVAHSEHWHWLNRLKKDFALWTVSSETERQWILQDKYGFDEQTVVATGFPRYDVLEQNVGAKTITIAPTWRKDLAVGVDDFIDSQYFQNLQALLNSSTLLEQIEKHDWQIKLVLHPNMTNFAQHFSSSSSRVQIYNEIANYVDLLNETKVFLTDYSGLMFDAAFARKTSLYLHFEEDNINASHIYGESYFDFEADGFGAVTHSVKEAIDQLCQIIESNGVLDRKYQKRIDNFFHYNDQKASARVFEEIIKL
jgi:CDP-glycerol glycerophosphotransferase (TagB/SpsB family)